MVRAVLDTNVVVSAMRSDQGPSFRLLSLIDSGRFEISVSVALILEIESVLLRSTSMNAEDVADLLDYLCSVANRQSIFYLWRPLLRDPKDDLVLELAVASGSQYIVTYNRRDFVGSERFGVQVLEPKDFLSEIGE